MGGGPGLAGELAALFRGRGDALIRDEDFGRMALRVHAAQRAANPVLRRFWDAAAGGSGGGGSGAGSGGGVANGPPDWRGIAPVPVAAFRDAPIVSGEAEAVYRTSGTTGGAGRRGEHHVASVDLYRAAARANYRRHLFAAAPGPLTLISLIPSPEAAPDSSLSAMAGFIAREPEIAETAWAFDPESGVDAAAVARAARAAAGPVLLLATSFSLVHLLDELEAAAAGAGAAPFRRGEAVLPPSSRIMETGGFKGRAAEVDRGTLHRRVPEALGVNSSHVVGEYGMTELLSQAYDGIAGAAPPPEERVYRFPSWVRTRALDPLDLSPLPHGAIGLLAHFDLANAGSACPVLTEDVGQTDADGGFRLLGRASGADLRGCSLTAEAFLRAAR